jgi:CheY-like chemotaxis protein
MDLNLPGVNGLRAFESIKSDPDPRLIPVIILSTSALPSDVRSSSHAYANYFVQKPTNFAQFEELICAIEALWMGFAVFASDDGLVRAVDGTDGKKGFPLANGNSGG